MGLNIVDESLIREQVEMLSACWRGLNALYEEYARSSGFSYSSLFVLYILYSNQENCTQKTICQRTFLPKQTVNAIVTGFLKQGLIEMKELETDRRHKVIRLTELGKTQSAQKIPAIIAAEHLAIERLEPEVRAALVEGYSRYTDNMRTLLQGERA